MQTFSNNVQPFVIWFIPTWLDEALEIKLVILARYLFFGYRRLSIEWHNITLVHTQVRHRRRCLKRHFIHHTFKIINLRILLRPFFGLDSFELLDLSNVAELSRV